MGKMPYTEDINVMRRAIMDAYPGTKWHERVMKMGQKQVYAVYMSLRERDIQKEREELRLREQGATTNPLEIFGAKPDEEYHQYDIFEYLASRNIKYN